MSIINPAAIGTKVNMRKKVDIEYLVVISSIKLPVRPAVQLAMKFAMNQIPNISPTRRAGASLLTYESPTGEIHNSPSVWNK